MLQAHSILWNYLWVAPNVLLLFLALLMWRRRLHIQNLSFFIFAIGAALSQLALYASDVIPAVSANTFWHVLWSGLLIEAVLKFLLIADLFSRIFKPYPSMSSIGKTLIRGVGAALVLTAALLAALSPVSNQHLLVAGPHLLEQTVYLIESGLLLFVFLFSAYFRLRADRTALGICLGLAISACVHLATWAIAANHDSAALSVRLDFVNMATYHVCVLIWYYYLLVPAKVRNDPPPPPLDPPTGPPPAEDLDTWNEEVERLLHR